MERWDWVREERYRTGMEDGVALRGSKNYSPSRDGMEKKDG